MHSLDFSSEQILLPGDETPPLEQAFLGKPPVPGIGKAFMAQPEPHFFGFELLGEFPFHSSSVADVSGSHRSSGLDESSLLG